MKTLDEKFNCLEKLLDEEHVFLDPELSFATICGWLEADVGEMDAMLMRELGMDGDILLAGLRKSMPERLERKYGIRIEPYLFYKDVM